jgi:hypothetical protein
MAFIKGRSGNPRGRPRGIPDKVSAEIRTLARALFDKDYWDRTKRLLDAGELHPKIETTLLAYAFGQPTGDAHHAGGLTVNLGILVPGDPQRPALQAPVIEAVSEPVCAAPSANTSAH